MDSGDDRSSTAGVGSYSTLIAGPASALIDTLTHAAVSSVASKYLQKAGIPVLRPGSHTLRHACVQRLVDGGFPLKTVGDYVGHRSPSSTMIYAKVQVDALREVALGDGEELQ
jgi:integrase/recombinase XerD